MSKKHKVLLTVLVVGLGGALAGFGVFSAFSSTTSNPGNTFAAGTVTLTDNDGGAAMFAVSNAKPGDTDRCIKVTYGGSLDATVKMYVDSISADGSEVSVTIHKSTSPGGQATNAACAGFVADGSAIYSDTLEQFGVDHSNWSNGLAANPGAATKWVQGNELSYRIRINVPDTAQGASIDPFELTWEAQNQ